MKMKTYERGKQAKWWQVRPLFALVLVLLTGGCLTLCKVAGRPQGSGPAGGLVEETDFGRSWGTGPVLLVGMGDSVVTGFGAGEGRGFFDMLQVQPKDDDPALKGCTLAAVYPGLRSMNLAVNSTNSAYHQLVQLRQLPVQDAQTRGIVVLSTGGIDLIHSYGSELPRDGALYGANWEEGQRYAGLFRARLEALLDVLAAKFSGGCDVFVMTIFDPTDGVGDIENAGMLLRLIKPLPAWPEGLRIHGLFNQHIREAAAARSFVHVVDVHAAMLGHGLHCTDKANPYYRREDPTYWYYVNLEDPNERGYDAIRREFLREMARVLAPR